MGARADLEAAVDEVRARFGDDGDVPLPPFWGGYVVEPDEVEFWQHRDDRLHDRLRYRRNDARRLAARAPPALKVRGDRYRAGRVGSSTLTAVVPWPRSQPMTSRIVTKTTRRPSTSSHTSTAKTAPIVP